MLMPEYERYAMELTNDRYHGHEDKLTAILLAMRAKYGGEDD